MSSSSKVTLEEKLVSTVDRIIKHEIRNKIKNFEVCYCYYSKDKKADITKFIAHAGEINIISYPVVTPNIYILCIFSTLSEILREINKGKNMKSVSIDFLVLRKPLKYTPFLERPFERDTKDIISTIKKGTVITDPLIELKSFEFKSLCNTLLFNLKGIENVKDFVLKKVKYFDIDEYLEKRAAQINGTFKTTIDNFIKNEREKKNTPSVKELYLNEHYPLIDQILRVIKTALQQEEKTILICPPETKKLVVKFFTDNNSEISDKKDNVLIATFPDPIHIEYKEADGSIDKDKSDPGIIRDSPPSYISLLSMYHNKEDVVYAIDEYYYSTIIDKLNCRLFECEKFHEKIEKEEKDKRGMLDLELYAEDKREKIKALKRELDHYEKARSTDVRSTDVAVRKIKDEITEKYIKKQKKELEVINNGFLVIQNNILDQLSLMT